MFAEDPDAPATQVEVEYLHYKHSLLWDFPEKKLVRRGKGGETLQGDHRLEVGLFLTMPTSNYQQERLHLCRG